MSQLGGDAPLVSARERPPRLALWFAVSTALGIVAATAVVVIVVRYTDTAEAVRQAIDRAQLAAHAVLRPGLRAADLSALLAVAIGAPLLVLLLAFVVSRHRRRIGALHRIAMRDELTGLPNRHGFWRATEQMLESRGGAVVLLDLDGFSEINDSLGAQSGDELLAQIAERLRYELDDCDHVARLGNDEFGVLAHRAEYGEIASIAERIRRTLATPFVLGGVRVAMSAAIGATLAERGTDFRTILRRAGAGLSTAKEEGHSSVQIAGPEQDLRDVSRLAIVAELRDALESGDLLVYYQPQSDLTTRRIRGVEALVRWEHPQDGLRTAEEFISYAERGGLSAPIRRFVLDAAAEQWSEWNELDIELELAVNLSAADMLDVSLPEEVSALLDRFGIPPWRLVLEITERSLIADVRRARRIVNRLERLGVRLAIDDFGTGYSSLSSLRTFAVQQVKLDRCLLEGVPGDAGAEAIIGGCVEIAHGVGATVVAEGVETPEQWRFVSLMGCDIAQGYLVGRPMPADELMPRLDVPNHVPLTAV